MEALLVRIDHFHDRRLYVSTVKGWLEALAVPGGRLVTVGDVHLLFLEGSRAQHDALLAKFASEPVDTNAKGEPCADRFIDVVGRKPIDKAVCKGFLEMNVLNAALLERLMVGDWHCDKLWLDDALSTPRTKALIKWREEAKSARKDRRKRAAQDRDAERAAKRAKAEEEKARLEAAKLAGEADDQDKDENDGDHDEEKEKDAEEDASGDEASITPTPAKSKTDGTAAKPPPPVNTPAHVPKKMPQGNPTKHNGKGSTQRHRPQQQHTNKSSGSRPANGKKHHPKKA